MRSLPSEQVIESSLGIFRSPRAGVLSVLLFRNLRISSPPPGFVTRSAHLSTMIRALWMTIWMIYEAVSDIHNWNITPVRTFVKPPESLNKSGAGSANLTR